MFNEDNAAMEMVKSIPEGFGAVGVQYTSWQLYSDFKLYKVPAGAALPDGKKLGSGEYVRFDYADHISHDKLYSFFESKENLVGWIRLDSFILETRLA